MGGSARGHNPGAAGTQQREPRRGLRRPPRAVRAEMPGSPSPLPCLDGQPRNAVSTRIAEPCGPTCRPRLSPAPRFLTHPSIQVPPETKTRWQGDHAEMTKRGVACIFGKPHRENLTKPPPLHPTFANNLFKIQGPDGVTSLFNIIAGDIRLSFKILMIIKSV